MSAILSFALTICLILLLHGASAMSVTVVDGGKSTVIQTRTTDVKSLFEEQNIKVGPNDDLSQALTASLQDGSRIVIDRAVGVKLAADGKSEIKYTTADTVQEALADLHVSVAAEDRVYPALGASVQDGTTIKIVRVKKDVVSTEHPVAYTIVKQPDNNLLEGKQKVVRTGKQGRLVKTYQRVYEDGKLVSEQMIAKSMEQPAVQQIVAVGAKKKAAAVKTLSYNPEAASQPRLLKLGGQTVKVKRSISNVTLTAYSAGPASTGKSKGDAGYGVTASGTQVSEGRTIAVDPKVIPIGWWVYIEGIGFRRAEDTGGAIKGKKIDVYFDSEKYANKFGLKRGYTVHVIGPVKPSAD
ncbi:3D domain-containing protein [Cohnella nanjingensis]|uniref:3D domain-containing protein n=1 Tax=Cohnella nanjingensis TaxID=1387779 RepID=UPI001FEB246D|nr:3D domain-containing protein [Cohnella nanjingensis]